MLATSENATVVPVEKGQEGTKEVDSVKNVAATESTTTTNPAPAADVVMDTPTDGESDEDDRMEVDDEHAELELEENDMAEIDASNILTSRTRGVKIDFANLPEEERLGADEDDEEDADVVMDDE